VSEFPYPSTDKFESCDANRAPENERTIFADPSVSSFFRKKKSNFYGKNNIKIKVVNLEKICSRYM
jgi:hypothetical protein